jgi:hypothetical protein
VKSSGLVALGRPDVIRVGFLPHSAARVNRPATYFGLTSEHMSVLVHLILNWRGKKAADYFIKIEDRRSRPAKVVQIPRAGKKR